MEDEGAGSCCNGPGERWWKHVPGVSASWTIMVWNILVADVPGLT